MPRQEGLRPIGESVKKIIEKIKKEREERQKKSSSPRTQPKLPGMKKGGGVDASKYKKKDKSFLDKVTDKLNKAGESYKSLGEAGLNVLRGDVKGQPYEKKKLGGEMKKDRRERDKQGLPPKPTTKPKPGRPMPPIKKKKDSGYGKTKNQPKSDFGVEYDKGGPSRPGKNITGYALKKGGITLKPANNPGSIRASIESLKDKTSPMKKERLLEGVKARLKKRREEDKQSAKDGGLIGNQRKLDANKDGKISGEDFKILRGKNNKMKGGGIAIKGTNFKGVF